MTELHVTGFLTLLKRSGLLTAAQWAAAQTLAKEFQSTQTATAEVASSNGLAAEMVRSGLLTQWQAGQLLKGQTGFVLGKYRLLEPVGKGGMGHVFKARDDESTAIVAIKVMSRKLTGNQTLVNRFRREIRASSLLKSLHIVRTLDAGRVGKVDFMVMEYVNGDQLDRIASRITAMPISVACDIIRQAAIGLQHAHEQRMVHRDIKPGNLIVDWSPEGNGTVKIMDMGLVRLSTDGDEKTSVTRAGQVMGTPDYMSPEQGWDTATVDLRSDIYSLGCTFFRLLTGRVPFPGDNPLQVLMARCSRDAPSAKSVRADIPDVVDGILRRMTLRDPDGRFQTAAEVVNALAPFSAKLTQDSLRKAMLDAGLEDPGFVVETPASEVDVQDVGYRQFLKEMDSGAAVDLMLTTAGGQDQSLSSTIPVLPEVERHSGNPRNMAVGKNRTAQTMALAAGGAAAALVGLFILVNRNSDPVPSPIKPDTNVKIPPAMVIPTAKLKPVNPVVALVGTAVTFQPEFDGTPPAAVTTGSLQFQLGKDSPTGISIDPQTGILLWAVPRDQSPQRYAIPIEYVFKHNDTISVVAELTFRVNVETVPIQYTMPETQPLRSLTGESIEVPMAATPLVPDGSGLTYRLGKDEQPGMSVHPVTGLFKWLPSDDDAGRHVVTVELCNTRTNDVLATGSITLVVLPVSLTLSFPAFGEQTAKAGEEFELKLTDRPKHSIGRVLRLRVMESSPAGIIIDQRAATLRWQVPPTASGRYEIRLKIEPILTELNIAPGSTTETLIVVNVEGTAPATLVPAESEIADAEKELRELYKREMAQAKSASDRALLARQLLDRSEGQTPGASDFALLNLAEETAEKCKATDVALNINRRRSERYKIDELPAAKVLMAEFRPGTTDAVHHDLIIEHSLRLAAVAAKKTQFANVFLFLQPAVTLLKKTDRGTFARQLADDVQQVVALSDELSKDAGSAEDLKILELNRILNRWQFASLFTAKESFSYLQSGNPATGLPDSGRSLWTLEDDHIKLDVKPAKGVLGIIETIREPGRYVIRMQVSSQTTSALLILGATRDQNLDCFLVTVDSSAFGQIATLPVVKTLAKGTPIPSTNGNDWNEVEILVDGQKLSIRLNGKSVSTTQISELRPGRLGLLLSLERVNPPPKLDIRHARILVLPDEP
ncbi:MAG TPA: protein kinase [Planctomycetaceae bacterium]|nr:protein kinase [Planctomycetaceae bacterium]